MHVLLLVCVPLKRSHHRALTRLNQHTQPACVQQARKENEAYTHFFSTYVFVEANGGNITSHVRSLVTSGNRKAGTKLASQLIRQEACAYAIKQFLTTPQPQPERETERERRERGK
jgi:hypothetical protein